MELKGEAMPVGKSIEHGFHQDFEGPMNSISTYLIYSNALNPSNRCDETVKELCQVRWSRVPKYDDLPSWKNPKGQMVKRLFYVIKMTSNGVSLDFEISHDRKIVASKNVVVDYRESGSVARRSETLVEEEEEDDDSGTYVQPESVRVESPRQSWGQSWDDHVARI